MEHKYLQIMTMENGKKAGSVELPYAQMHYEEPVVIIEFKEDAVLGFIEIRELTYYAQELSEHKPYVVLSDVRKIPEITPVGKKIATTLEEAPLNKGNAVLVDNEGMRLAANFLVHLKKPPYPFKAFTDKEAARQWLLQLLL